MHVRKRHGKTAMCLFCLVIIDSTSSGSLTVHTVHYDSLVGNGMTSATIPPEYVIMLVSVLTVILVFIVLWLIRLLRER